MAKRKIKKNSDADLEQALDKVSKEIQENNLQSNQPTNPIKGKEKKMPAKKTTAAKTPKNTKSSKEAPVAGFTAKDLATELGIEPVDLRKALRAIKAEKPGKSWAWAKKTDKALGEIRKNLKAHLKAASSKPAKTSKPAKGRAAAKKPAAKKTPKRKAKAAE